MILFICYFYKTNKTDRDANSSYYEYFMLLAKRYVD